MVLLQSLCSTKMQWDITVNISNMKDTSVWFESFLIITMSKIRLFNEQHTLLLKCRFYPHIFFVRSGKILFSCCTAVMPIKWRKKRSLCEMVAYKHMNKEKGSRLASIFPSNGNTMFDLICRASPPPFMRWNDGLLKRHWISLHWMTSSSASGSPKRSYLMHCYQCSVIAEHSTKPNKNSPRILRSAWYQFLTSLKVFKASNWCFLSGFYVPYWLIMLKIITMTSVSLPWS